MDTELTLKENKVQERCLSTIDISLIENE
jgi:hypothetical protein